MISNSIKFKLYLSVNKLPAAGYCPTYSSSMQNKSPYGMHNLKPFDNGDGGNILFFHDSSVIARKQVDNEQSSTA